MDDRLEGRVREAVAALDTANAAQAAGEVRLRQGDPDGAVDARDLAGWMAGALERLGPFLVVDASARRVARGCIIWQGQLAAARGDPEAAGTTREALRLLDSLDDA